MSEEAVSACSFVVEPPDLWTSSGIQGAPRRDETAEAPCWVVGSFRCEIRAWQVMAALGDPGRRGLEPVRFSELPDDVFDPRARLAAQDQAGVVAEVLYPTPRLWGAIGLVLDSDTEIACVRAYNDWLAAFVGTAPDRFVGVGLIAAQGGVDTALSELRRISEAGLKGVHLRAFPSGPKLGVEDDAFWSEVVALGLVVSFDGSFGPSLGRAPGSVRGAGGPDDAVKQFVYQGVVDRFPTMRYVVSASTAGWIPAWLERGDDGYLRFPAAQNKDLLYPLPSDYLRRRPFYTYSGRDLILDHPDAYISFTHLMWSSQYPTFQAFEAPASFAQLAELSPEVRDAITGGTCRSLYRLPGGTEIDFEPHVDPLPHAVPA